MGGFDRAPAMRLWFGHRPRPLHMTATRQYTPEELHVRLVTVRSWDQQAWLQVENEKLLLTEGDLSLAARVSASYHNQLCYNAPDDDGWNAETAAMEAEAEERQAAPPSDNSDTEVF